jgi:hypothetical protein
LFGIFNLPEDCLPQLHWKLKPAAPAGFLAGENGFSHLIKQIFYNRGLETFSSVSAFLEGGESLSHDPYLMPISGRLPAGFTRRFFPVK